MAYILAIVTSIINGFCPMLKKKYVKNTNHIKTNLDVYMLIVYPFATLIYFLLAKGNVPLNLPTFIFSVIYAFISIASTVFGLSSYNFTSVVYVAVFTGAGTTILPFLYELLFTDIVFSVNKILSVILRVCAVALPLVSAKGDRSTSKKGFLMCILLFLIGGASGIIVRIYATFPGVESDGSFFFWTNVVTMPIVCINMFRKSGKTAIFDGFKQIDPRNYIYALSSMLISNSITFTSIELIRMISGTVYNIISASLHMIISAFISVVMFKESMSKQSVISVVLSVAAIILSLA